MNIIMKNIIMNTSMNIIMKNITTIMNTGT